MCAGEAGTNGSEFRANAGEFSVDFITTVNGQAFFFD